MNSTIWAIFIALLAAVIGTPIDHWVKERVTSPWKRWVATFLIFGVVFCVPAFLIHHFLIPE